jgi:hypothetical protein
MYEAGYRVAIIPTSFLSDMILGTCVSQHPVTIERTVTGDDFDNRGHLNLRNGKLYAPLFADARRSNLVLVALPDIPRPIKKRS